MKTTTICVVVSMADATKAPREVACRGSAGVWAITPTHGWRDCKVANRLGWTVTHAPTGFGVVYGQRYDEARRILRALREAGLCDYGAACEFGGATPEGWPMVHLAHLLDRVAPYESGARRTDGFWRRGTAE